MKSLYLAAVTRQAPSAGGQPSARRWLAPSDACVGKLSDFLRNAARFAPFGPRVPPSRAPRYLFLIIDWRRATLPPAPGPWSRVSPVATGPWPRFGVSRGPIRPRPTRGPGGARCTMGRRLAGRTALAGQPI